MDTNLNNQIDYAKKVLDQYLSRGPKIWDASEKQAVPTSVRIGNEFWTGRGTGQEVSGFCIACKRQGEYAKSIFTYLQLFDACVSETGKLPLVYVRGFWKTLLCANAFGVAFDLAATVLADIQNDPSAAYLEIMTFEQYFEELSELAIKTVHEENYSSVRSYCANYAGNPQYTLVKNSDEIRAEMLKIWLTIRMHESKNH